MLKTTANAIKELSDHVEHIKLAQQSLRANNTSGALLFLTGAIKGLFEIHQELEKTMK